MPFFGPNARDQRPALPHDPENTKALRGAGALDRIVRPVYWLEMLVFANSSQPTAL